MLEKSWCSSWSVSLAHSAAYSVDYDLFMEGTTQEGGSQLAVGEQEGKSWQDMIDGGNAEETGDRDTHLKTPWHTRMRGEGRLRGCKIARHLEKLNISKYFKLFQTMALNLSSGLSFHSFYWRIFFLHPRWVYQTGSAFRTVSLRKNAEDIWFWMETLFILAKFPLDYAPVTVASTANLQRVGTFHRSPCWAKISRLGSCKWALRN